MVYIADETVERWIKEDAPYGDLTTWLMGIDEKHGKIEYFSREETVLCGTEEAARIFIKFGAKTQEILPSGTFVKPGQLLLTVEGSAAGVHQGWKIALNILEYASGIATRTQRLVKAAQNINPNLEIVATRKNFPGTKELAIKAILAGGALPHRLGLSETILIFAQHRVFLDGFEALVAKIPELKARACEKKIIVEVETLEEAIQLAKAGVDGIQFDKVDAAALAMWIQTLRGINPQLVLLAAGGVNENNIAAYAKTGINAVATTAVFFGKPADIKAKISKLDRKE